MDSFLMPENPYNLKKGYIGITDPFNHRVLLERGFNEGCQAQRKSIYRWGLEDCPHDTMEFDDDDRDWIPITRCECPLCWGELNL